MLKFGFLFVFILGYYSLFASSFEFYINKISVKCKTKEEANNARLTFLPLPHGKKIAFSSRWDDSSLTNIKIKNLLTKHNYRGTFYLTHTNRKEFWQEVFPQLCKDGFSVGNHTLKHKELPKLTANGIHNEIMALKIMIESYSNQCINSFIIPYGKINSQFFPNKNKEIGSSLRRAGIYGGADFSPDMYKLYQTKETAHFSTNLVRPGDRNTKSEKFDLHVTTHLKTNKEHLSLGIHAWHSDNDLKVLEQSLKKYANKTDWWYCNETEYIAYKLQYHNAKIVKKEVKDDTVTFDVALIIPEITGSNIPLAAICNNTKIEIKHQNKSVPQIIDTASIKNGKSHKIPKITAFLKKYKDDTFKLELTNNGSPLSNITMRLALPPVYNQEYQMHFEKCIDKKFSFTFTSTPSQLLASSGKELTALTIDFTQNNIRKRLWIQNVNIIKHDRSKIYPIYYKLCNLTEDELKLLSKKNNDKDFTKVESNIEQNIGVFTLRPGKKWSTNSTVIMLKLDGKKKITLTGTLPKYAYLNGKKLSVQKKNKLYITSKEQGSLILYYPIAKRPLNEVVLLCKAK